MIFPNQIYAPCVVFSYITLTFLNDKVHKFSLKTLGFNYFECSEKVPPGEFQDKTSN
jgi:hypothetical protein